MKALLLLLLTAFSAAAHAQAIYRCEDSLANVVYRDTPCVALRGANGADQTQPYEPGAPAPPLALAGLEAASPGDWEIGQPSARRVQARREAFVIALRVQARQKPLDDRHAAQSVENRHRCAIAMRVADRCGKFAGKFYCGEKGFMPITQDAAPRSVALDNGNRYKMERCAALDAAKNGP